MIAAFALILALDDVMVTTQELRMDWPCTDEAPRTMLDKPKCSDYDLDTAWLEAAEQGDRSVIPVLRQRYAMADSIEEKNRIAGALLRRVPDDRAIWKELLRHAEIVVRFPHVQQNQDSAEFVQWCAERGIDPETYWYISLRALEIASHDPRSHALLMTALQSEDDGLVMWVVQWLGAQRDEASLPLIEKAIRRLPDVVWSLRAFESERADAIAKKYLSAEKWKDYRSERLGIDPED